MPADFECRVACAPDHGPGNSMVKFWPRSMALNMNAYLLTHPCLDAQRWFEAQITRRILELTVSLEHQAR